ncbi:hypothetical protein [Bisbaumannia pacifica]|uniref:hypothetical protein n=1 Tax=Bisbaumannia pacifica TaxID=77098 RepID=UPI003BEED7F6
MHRIPALRLAFALCMITTAVNLQAPLYAALATRDGVGVGATTLAFACFVLGVLPVLLALSGLVKRLGRRLPILLALRCLRLWAGDPHGLGHRGAGDCDPAVGPGRTWAVGLGRLRDLRYL